MNENDARRRTVSLPTYQRQNSEVFASPESLKWFVRRNRDELVQAGALVMPVGKKLVVVERFDQVVMTIGQRRAKEFAR